MYDGDDIDLLYVLAPHGWSVCILHIGDRIHKFLISHVFSDPIRDLIEATVSLLNGSSDVEFIWWDEPGGNQWRIVKNPDQHHRVKITVTVQQPRYSKEEFARRGDEIYEFQVRPQVEEDNRGKIVAIDIETGAFEIDASEIAACDRLEAYHPDAQIWSFVLVPAMFVDLVGARKVLHDYRNRE